MILDSARLGNVPSIEFSGSAGILPAGTRRNNFSPCCCLGASHRVCETDKESMPDTNKGFEVREKVLLAPMTTIGIGGPARYYAEVTDTATLLAGVAWARSRGVPLFVLGGGSNIVVADGGFPGLVLRMSICGVESYFEGSDVVVSAGAGEEWDSLVAHSVAQGWAGFECLSGIPGRVGATPIQNVGAYGQETSETLVSVEALDLVADQLVHMSLSDCQFGYRTSRFKTRDRGRFIITRVTYRLSVNGTPAVRYPELQRYLSEEGLDHPAPSDVREAVLTIRRRKAMVIDSRDVDSRGVGSFFVNPTVTRDELERIRQILGSAVEQLPAFPATDDRVKLSAAWLIERAGIKRGYVYSGVGTSTKHALAIINRGGGTAAEVVELKQLIQERVVEEFGVMLQPEPVFVGFEE
jgi:UDP-N-acetylmuramate dehydrogenase